jgi:hypothetical protein
MAVNFLDRETLKVTNSGQKQTTGAERSTQKRESLITTSEDVSGIELRMLPPMIKENGTAKVWPFPGYAKLYCLTIVVSDAGNQLVGAIDLKGFPRIGSDEHLPINKTIFYWQAENDQAKSPNQIHVMCSVIKSKESLRDTGNILGKIKSDDEYKTLIGSLGAIAKDAASFNLVTDIMMDVAGVVGKHLGRVEDKPLGTVVNSYTTLYGDFDKVGINPYTYTTRNVDFTFHLTVRSAKAEKQLAGGSHLESVESAGSRTRGGGVTSEEKQEEVEVEMMPL